ncbi:MAG: lipase family protein [Actinomycetia bacterium]|nr:lipase family protein [Actinomycetes bacterium]
MTRAVDGGETSGSTVGRLWCGLLSIVLVVSGCGNSSTGTEAAIAAPIPTPPPIIAPDASKARGEIVEQFALTNFFDDEENSIGEARRAVYRSVSGIDGGVRDVSGVFLIPPGSPPPGGWPVLSIAHGTTGIGNDCGPSRDPELMGSLPAAKAYLADGYAVAISDYEGLGERGRHPYLEPRTSAFNVTDAVRALRSIFPDISTQWVAFGNSQGGQAAWAANEVAGWYGTGLDLVGSVALSPAANVTALADLARYHSLTSDQQAVMPLVVAGVERFTPELTEHSLLPDFTPEQEGDIFSCEADSSTLRADVLSHSIRLDDPATTALLRDALRRIALPQEPLAAPMLVINGLDDQTILPQWVTTAVDGACELGGRVEHFEVADAGHGDLGSAAYEIASEWVRDRFDSLPAPSNCGAPPTVLS